MVFQNKEETKPFYKMQLQLKVTGSEALNHKILVYELIVPETYKKLIRKKYGKAI